MNRYRVLYDQDIRCIMEVYADYFTCSGGGVFFYVNGKDDTPDTLVHRFPYTKAVITLELKCE